MSSRMPTICAGCADAVGGICPWASVISDGLPHRRRFVLVVEEDPELARWYERAMGAAMAPCSRGLDVSVATSGPQALLRIAKEKPDVLVIDLGMRSMSAHELITTILTGHTGACHPRCIAVARRIPPDIAVAGALPASVRVLYKPLNAKEVVAAIVHAMTASAASSVRQWGVRPAALAL